MKTRTQWMTAAAVVVLTVSTATFAHAQAVPRRHPVPNGPAWNQQSAYDDGYRMGALDGERDGRDGRGSRANARAAWNSRGGRYGNDVRRAFEDGYNSGYREGYARFDRRGSRDRGYDPSYRRPGSDGNGGYYGNGGYGDYGRYRSPAVDQGYRDGYEEGLDAGRDRDRFDPVGEKDYRKADRGYNGRYGSKAQYQAAYRDAFRQGYEEGYRDAGQYDRRGGARAPWGARWPFVF
jgi:hypothetical protein